MMRRGVQRLRFGEQLYFSLPGARMQPFIDVWLNCQGAALLSKGLGFAGTGHGSIERF